MEALELLKVLLTDLRQMQFDPLQRSHGETDAGYRNGHNDGIRAAIKCCEQHLGFAFACTKGCGWNVRVSQGIAQLQRYIRCAQCQAPVEMAEVVV